MFTRSDMLLQEEIRKPDIHFLSFQWDGFVPRFYGYDKESERVIEFDLWKLNHKISHSSTCTGSWRGGLYTPCPEQRRVSGFSVCNECATSFIPILACIFEPRCDGTKCDVSASKFCKREHVVYVSFQGKLAKIGMTSSMRIRQRQIEQGSDAYAMIGKVDGRRSARYLESQLSETLGLRQAVRTLEQLSFMVEEPDVPSIEKKHAKISEYAGKLGHKVGKLNFLDEYPISQPLEVRPLEAVPDGRHTGKVLGFKGKYVFYNNQDGKLRALNLQKSVGRFIKRT